MVSCSIFKLLVNLAGPHQASENFEVARFKPDPFSRNHGVNSMVVGE